MTRFHHSAADGLSAALWLGHQLNVAYGLEEVERERASFVDLPLRNLSTSVRRSQFAFDGASDRLWTSTLTAFRKATMDHDRRLRLRSCRKRAGELVGLLITICSRRARSKFFRSGIKHIRTEQRSVCGCR